MVAGLLICSIFGFLVWLVFFKFRWLKFSILWGVVSLFFGAHLLLIFLVGMRFMTPASTSAVVVQHTIQLVPRLSQPTMVTEVLVEQNTPVKKGQPLFRFDDRPYVFQVKQLQAQLAQAKQNVKVLQADVMISKQKVNKALSQLELANYQLKLTTDLSSQGAGPVEEQQKALAQVKVEQAAVLEARAEVERAELECNSQIDGVNTQVAALQAELEQAQFYLDNTTIYAPEDGRIANLQVRPGMVAGIIRIGAIASFICDDNRYLLANYFQENLKYVKVGQPVEVAMNLYPGQIFPARVQSIWKVNGSGQFLPSGTLPEYTAQPPETPQGQYAVQITFDDPDQSKFPIGAGGIAAIYTEHQDFAYLRKISIRAHSWLNWLYPLDI